VIAVTLRVLRSSSEQRIMRATRLPRVTTGR